MQLEVRKGDLFENATPGAALAHACNCQGVWGSGIALDFKKRFPEAYESYKWFCRDDIMPGVAFIGKSNVVCLFTSKDYGARKDPPEMILKATYNAALQFLKSFHSGQYTTREIHSPKINAGFFGVPWEDTEKVLKQALVAANTDTKWIVWEKAESAL